VGCFGVLDGVFAIGVQQHFVETLQDGIRLQKLAAFGLDRLLGGGSALAYYFGQPWQPPCGWRGQAFGGVDLTVGRRYSFGKNRSVDRLNCTYPQKTDSHI
jgi:hypothetical protein